jgi:hypothetical protein
MEFDTVTAGDYAAAKLDSLIERSHRDSLALIDNGDIVALIRHFDKLRDKYRELKAKVERLEEEVNILSYTAIPDAFNASPVKPPLKIDDVGTVSIGHRWVASMPDKEVGFRWLRNTGNDSLIIETVNAQTLAAFAKAEASEGRPLPDEIFNVGISTYTSIRNGRS